MGPTNRQPNSSTLRYTVHADLSIYILHFSHLRISTHTDATTSAVPAIRKGYGLFLSKAIHCHYNDRASTTLIPPHQPPPVAAPPTAPARHLRARSHPPRLSVPSRPGPRTSVPTQRCVPTVTAFRARTEPSEALLPHPANYPVTAVQVHHGVQHRQHSSRHLLA